MRRRDQMTPRSQEIGSSAICSGLIPECCVDAIALYAPLPGEPDVRSVVESLARGGVRVFLPRYSATAGFVFARFESWERLRPGRFGILEPAPESDLAVPGELSAAVVPGLAFDLDGFRLGRGGGVYDRCFAKRTTRPRLIGVSFDWQIVDRLPREAHDVAVDCVITDLRRFETTRRTR
jgi:5-formyltetrahydrofolate cyclo-ligase